MEKPILYYWAPCSTCSVAVNLADELGIELDKRDVDQNYLQDDGMMGISTMDADGLFGVPVMAGLDKAARLDYGESLMTHAMVFQGVNFDGEGKPTLWRVENSWGKDHGHDGYDLMTDDWFSEYVYQVVVDRKYLTEDELAAYDSAPTPLAPWDPMGALA